MRMLIVYVFISALMFGCSSEKSEEAAPTISASKLEALPDWDSLPSISKLEALPDWDSLPPIEEE